jgi:cell division protein ZapA (FtsZ GTPase activity inhibitor)
MAETKFRILGEDLSFECAPENARRLEDLAAALSARLDAIADAQGGCADARRVLALAALGLLDENQQAGAALARARAEIDRLNEFLAEARAKAANTDPSARITQGAA